MDVLDPESFARDRAFVRPAPAIEAPAATIAGVEIVPLVPMGDGRGALVELLTQRDGPIEAIVHVYQVRAVAGSLRAWVYHERQTDRLAYTDGRFRVALYDIRQDSPTKGALDVFEFGEERPARLHIPPLVAHGVQNRSGRLASFVNMPTRPYLPDDPDKRRVPYPDPRIPYTFD